MHNLFVLFIHHILKSPISLTKGTLVNCSHRCLMDGASCSDCRGESHEWIPSTHPQNVVSGTSERGLMRLGLRGSKVQLWSSMSIPH